MSDLEKYFFAKGFSKSTVKTYYKSTLDFIAWLDKENVEAEKATNGDVTSYLNYLQKKGLANFTRSIQLNIIKHFFDYQIEKNQRKTNPAAHLKIRGSKRKTLYPTLSKIELESIYQNYTVPVDADERANRNWFIKYKLAKQRNKVILGLMIWQGLTTPEINNLLLADVKLREGNIFIAGGRKSAERTLELKPQQIVELMEYQFTTRNELLKYSNQPSERFFVSVPQAGKTKSTGNDTQNAWKRLSDDVEKICPRFINFKQVRASVITHLLSANNLRQVQYMAGHKYVSSTEAYLVGQIEDLQADIDKFHPF